MSSKSRTYTADQLLELISRGVVDSFRGIITEKKFKSVVSVLLDEAVIDPTSVERYRLSNDDYLKVYSDIDAGYSWGKCQHRTLVYSVILEINDQKFRTVRNFLGDPSDPVLEEVTQHVYLDNIYKILHSSPASVSREKHPTEDEIFKLFKRTRYVTYSPSIVAHSHKKKKRRLFQWSLYSRRSLDSLLKSTDDVTFHLSNRKTIKVCTVLARSSEYYSIYTARILLYENSQFLVHDKSVHVSLSNINLLQTSEEHIQYLPYPKIMCADRAADLDQYYGRSPRTNDDSMQV